MRATPWIGGLAALAAGAASAQMAGPNSMSPIPGTELPDSNSTQVDRGLRDFTVPSGTDGRAQRRASAAYQENLRIRREQARQYAAAALSGLPLPVDAAATLRGELQADIEQWRTEFAVGRKDAQAMRERWLVPLDSLTAVEWAQQRVAWWSARDGWVAARR
jgi:hypothetical protein